MKMLLRDSNINYLKSLKEMLEDNGIPAVIQGTETARMVFPAFMLEPTLWVFIDSQFEDAAKLIMNPGHQVTTGIDVEVFYENQPNQKEMTNAVINALGNMVAYLVIFMIAAFIIIKVL